jgi:hypothetical protein
MISAAAGFPLLAPVAVGAPSGEVYGNLLIGVAGVAILVGCWLYARK